MVPQLDLHEPSPVPTIVPMERKSTTDSSNRVSIDEIKELAEQLLDKINQYHNQQWLHVIICDCMIDSD